MRGLGGTSSLERWLAVARENWKLNLDCWIALTVCVVYLPILLLCLAVTEARTIMLALGERLSPYILKVKRVIYRLLGRTES